LLLSQQATVEEDEIIDRFNMLDIGTKYNSTCNEKVIRNP
jgi:hypothetical protein